MTLMNAALLELLTHHCHIVETVTEFYRQQHISLIARAKIKSLERKHEYWTEFDEWTGSAAGNPAACSHAVKLYTPSTRTLACRSPRLTLLLNKDSVFGGTEPESEAQGSLSNLAIQGDMFGHASSFMLDIWLCARVSLDNLHNKLIQVLCKKLVLRILACTKIN